MMIRRLPLLLLPVVVLAGCSSGSSKVADSTPTSPTVTSEPSATSSPTAASTVSGGGATDFCGAFKELDSAKGATNPAVAGAAFRAAAADMRRYAPADIKPAAGTYADVMDNIGKAAQGGGFGEQGMQKAIAEGMAGKAADIGKVAVWVSKNCHL